MNSFIKKLFYFFLAGLIPLIILTIGYFYFDPFKVLKSYNDYSYCHVMPNRDYISTEVFMRNNDQQHYNSFIFGSSRTLAFHPSSWIKYLPANAKPFMFDASGESIYGIYTKLRFLDSLKIPLENALIIMCRDNAFNHEGNHEGLLNMKHPKTSGESNFNFQFEFYKAYLGPKFISCFYTYNITKQYQPYMKGIIENRKVTYDKITNEFNIVDQEEEITTDPVNYYKKRAKLFYARNGEKKDTVQHINGHFLFMLTEIERILNKNKTDYKLVLSPLYEQIKYNQKDFGILKDIFGNRLYDFSGKNEYTNPISNYYENSHFRPSVGDSIFSKIYQKAL